MSYSPPTPPQDLPPDVIEMLENQSPEALRQIARYAEELVEYREREKRLATEAEEEKQIEHRPAELPDDVPAKATITVKEINENHYYYWQWRDGDKIRSKYKGPVEGNE